MGGAPEIEFVERARRRTSLKTIIEIRSPFE
jgi:hypothetical protein